MAILSFTKVEENIQSTAKTLINMGSHKGKIIEMKIVSDKFNNEDTYNITFLLDEGEITKKFPLWSSNDIKKYYANKDIRKLFQLLNIRVFEEGEKLEIEDEALKGKECGLVINHKVKPTGETYAFVESFYKLPNEKADPTIPNDQIGF